METKIGNYYISVSVHLITIDYKKSFKDFYYSYIYLIISLVLFFLFSFLFYNLYKTTFLIEFNTIIGYSFSVLLFLAGLYFLLVPIETLIKPSKNVFVINKKEKTLKVRKNIFQSNVYPFEEVLNFELSGKKMNIIMLHRGRRYKRELLIFDFAVLFKNNRRRKIHSFEKSELIIPFNKKKSNKSLKENSKKISYLIATNLNKEVIYKQIERIE
ncbi:MAG: hypothetical protein WCY89_03730 [Flavobacteriaceae bacterium]